MNCECSNCQEARLWDRIYGGIWSGIKWVASTALAAFAISFSAMMFVAQIPLYFLVCLYHRKWL